MTLNDSREVGGTDRTQNHAFFDLGRTRPTGPQAGVLGDSVPRQQGDRPHRKKRSSTLASKASSGKLVVARVVPPRQSRDHHSLRVSFPCGGERLDLSWVMLGHPYRSATPPPTSTTRTPCRVEPVSRPRTGSDTYRSAPDTIARVCTRSAGSKEPRLLQRLGAACPLDIGRGPDHVVPAGDTGATQSSAYGFARTGTVWRWRLGYNGRDAPAWIFRSRERERPVRPPGIEVRASATSVWRALHSLALGG